MEFFKESEIKLLIIFFCKIIRNTFVFKRYKLINHTMKEISNKSSFATAAKSYYMLQIGGIAQGASTPMRVEKFINGRKWMIKLGPAFLVLQTIC
jgi:hypothetical protein